MNDIYISDKVKAESLFEAAWNVSRAEEGLQRIGADRSRCIRVAASVIRSFSSRSFDEPEKIVGHLAAFELKIMVTSMTKYKKFALAIAAAQFAGLGSVAVHSQTLEEVVVTARKKPESLMDAPLTVSVV